MNQVKATCRAVNLQAQGWTPYQPGNFPSEGQTVEVCMPGHKQVLIATYDPKWEHGFRCCNEALPNRPTLWRAIPEYRTKRTDYKRPVEFVV